MTDATTEPGEQRMLALISYILHLIGALTGVTGIIGAVINFVRRDAPSPFGSHHRWMLRTFIWTFLWSLLGGLLVFLVITAPIGWLLFFVLWVWWVYRHVRGLIALLSDSPLPG